MPPAPLAGAVVAEGFVAAGAAPVAPGATDGFAAAVGAAAGAPPLASL